MTRADATTSGKSRFRIGTRLALLAIVLAVPFAGYSVYSSIEDARIERDHVAAEMLGTAQIAAARLDAQINGIRALLQVAGAAISVDPVKTESNDAYLRNLASHIPRDIDNLTVWTPSGDNIGSLDARFRRGGATNSAQRPFLRDAIASPGGDMSADAPVVSNSNGSFISVFGLPVRRDGQVVGVVAAEARLGSLQELLRASADLPSSAVVTVTNARGIILASSVDPNRWVGKSIVGSIAGSDGAPSLDPEGVREGLSADGISRIAGFTTARAAPWRIYVGVSRNEALAPVYARLRSHLLTAGLVLLAGLLMAASVGRGIASPLRELSRDAAEFGSGNLAHRSRLGCGEVGIVAGTINQMAEQLQERTHALHRSKEQLQQLTKNLPAPIAYLDEKERFRFANDAYESWFGQDPRQFIGKALIELDGVEAYDAFKADIHRALDGTRVTHERELKTLQGPRRVELTAIPDFDVSGRVNGLFVMMVDVTARQEAELALAQSEHRLRTLADNLPAIVTYVDRDQRYQFVNAHLGEVFGIDSSSLLGRTVCETNGKKLYAEIEPHVTAALRGEEVIFQGTWAVKDRSYHYQSTYIPDIDGRGAVRGYYELTFDISALKEEHRELDMLARVDSLTGLPNRRRFEECLHDAMGRTRHSGNLMALMFLDIDHFKSINDTLGHGAGDLVLKEFASRLEDQVRNTDLVARLAGDEFVVLIEAIHDLEALKALAAKIIVSVRSPLTLARHPVSVTASMGVSLFDGGEDSSADLLAAADRALYTAKRQGRNRFSLAGQGLASILDLAAVRDRSAGDLAA